MAIGGLSKGRSESMSEQHEGEEIAKAEVDFGELIPPEDDKVYINQQGLVIMNIRTLAKLQAPDTRRKLLEAAAAAHYKLFTKGQTNGR